VDGAGDDTGEEEEEELEERVNIDELNVDETFSSGILNAQELSASTDESDDSSTERIADQLGF